LSQANEKRLRALTGAAKIAGVVGQPITHSLSPRLHGAWLEALGLDGAYVPFSTDEKGFVRLVEGFRGGVIRGLNVTLPFKEAALHIADHVDLAARTAGAANVLIFHPDGGIEARNTDGVGMFHAFNLQAPDWRADHGPVTVLGAGGAARGAVAALVLAGAKDIRVLNRTLARAEQLCAVLPCQAFGWAKAQAAFDGAATVINATSGQLSGDGALPLPTGTAPAGAVAMDMVYKPLRTPFLAAMSELGWTTVDGLDMLIGQARPSFAAFFGVEPPEDLDARALLLSALNGDA
jgi:shikimate dehydrogenase